MNDKVWDYRIVRSKKYQPSDDNSIAGYDERYSIQEVYYDDDGQPMAQTIDLTIEGDTITEMRTQLERMINCLDQSVLDESDIIPTLSEGSNIETEGFEFPTEGNWIYESPDGGATIYRRKMGEDDREKIEKGL